jgi:Flp pilus assembly protein TadG
MTNISRFPLLRRFHSDEGANIAELTAFSAIPMSMAAALIVIQGQMYNAQQQLQMSANMAALAGASELTTSPTSAVSTATQYSADNTAYGLTPTMVSGYPKTLCVNPDGSSCSGAANAVQVQQQVTIPLYFGGLFGANTTTLTATATAGATGGVGTAADIMIIIDTTASMSDSDSNCSVTGATRLGCALAGAKTLLTAFNPAIEQVGIMAFPGVKNATQAADDYACPGSQPTTVAYNNSPDYVIVGLSSDYKTSDTATTLNPASNIVKAVGGVSGCKGLQAPGGFGTFYADAITAAQNTLNSTGRAGVQKVIILLSDGDANAKAANPANISSSEANNQCHEAITAAQNATNADTWVFTAAYGSPTGSSCSTDKSPTISACATMQAIASTSSMFFPDIASAAAGCTSTINPANDVIGIFNDIGKSLTGPHLVPTPSS